jgi:hypothetical protein
VPAASFLRLAAPAAAQSGFAVERMEFLFGGAMLRIHTREFIRTMLGAGIDLRPPVFVDMASPPFCR